MAIAQLEIPDLDTRIAQKRAEVDKARAELRLVEIGTRPEEVVEQRGRVERAKAWRDRARQDLARLQEAHRQELAALRAQVLQDRAERKVFEGTHRRAKALFDRGYLSPAQYHDEEKNSKVAQAKLDQAEARYRAREAEGTLEAEAELARRDKELADAQASLTLLEAGSRPEELAASRARLAQLAEELSYLEGLLEKLQISSPLSGVITTPRLREKIGQHLPEGELIGEVQAVSALEAEIAIDEQTVSRARVGQAVELRARALTFQTFHARVDRIAPSAVRGEADTKATVTVYCRLEGPAAGLRSEMTGYARIDCGRRPIGEILAERILGFLRTEFWL
jgi:HlyD family secretion protein